MSPQKNNVFEEERLKWYLDAKFGMFIHWGAYAAAGAEASWPIMAPRLSEAMFVTPSDISEKEYVKLPEKFNPVNFDAKKWVETAKQAGMKYMVITSKHHDGFCMFDAPGTDYKITNTPFGRDICKELADACKEADMKLGFYYSPPDMHHPGYRDTSKPATQNWLGEPERSEWGSYLDYMESHLRKLLTDYGDVCVIWFDGLCYHEKYQPERFHKLIHELSPNTLINDRLGEGYDFVTPEQFIPKKGIPVKTGKPSPSLGIDSEKFFKTVVKLFKIPIIRGWIRAQMRKYSSGELELTPVQQESYPSPERFQPWETCMTIGQSWAYNPNETKWKKAKELISNLVKVTGLGGNYLLNVGPNALGEIPRQATSQLELMGSWLKKNSEAIYSTEYTKFNNMKWGNATRKGSTLYLNIINMPENRIVTIEDFSGQVKSTGIISGESTEFEQTGKTLKISVPKQSEDEYATVIKVELEEGTYDFNDYCAPEPLGAPPKEYVKKSMAGSAKINGIANGIIAVLFYLSYTSFSLSEVVKDVFTACAIISFLTGWIMIAAIRKDIKDDKVAVYNTRKPKREKPIKAILKAFVVMIICTLALGGVLNALAYIIIPSGISNWGYMIYKALFTAACGALSVLFSAVIVFNEYKKEDKEAV